MRAQTRRLGNNAKTSGFGLRQSLSRTSEMGRKAVICDHVPMLASGSGKVCPVRINPRPGGAHRQVRHANRRLDLVLGTWARLLMPSSAQQAELIAY